jgi:asparagine synthase (glutamine-hydrolysing)
MLFLSLLLALNINNLLTLRYDPTATLGNSNISKISPKEILGNRNGTFADGHKAQIPSHKDIELELRNIIRERIENLSPKRISIALSAGIDSNLILCLIRREFPQIDIHCITVSFNDELSEIKYAREIAESQDGIFHSVYVQDPLKDLPKLLDIVKEPRWNIYQFHFIEKARAISNVLFTGDGGDELFAGYIFRYKKFLENYKTNFSWLDKVKLYLMCHERDWVPDQQEMFGTKIKFRWSSVHRILRKYFDNELDPLEQVLLADYHGKLLYDFIPTNNKYFKYFGIDGISPLLHSNIINISKLIPSNQKYDLAENLGKIPLHKILKDNMPLFYSLEQRKKKMGFGMDLIKLWFGEGKETVMAHLDDGRIFEDKLIDKDWYKKALSRINENKDPRYISKMLQLLSLEIWYRLFFTHEIKANSSL